MSCTDRFARQLALAFLIASAATSTAQQPIRYAPKPGSVFDYGVEFRLGKATDDKSSAVIDVTQRCRLRYTITEVDGDSWTATYATIPSLSGTRIGKATNYKTYIDRLRKRVAAGPPSTPMSTSTRLTPPGFPDPMERMQTLHERAHERAKIRLENHDTYHGIYQFCRGTIRVSRRGEVLKTTGQGLVPMLVGHIATVPLIQLPEDARQNAEFGYRETLTVVGQEVESNREFETSAAILTVVKKLPATADTPMAVFDFERELAGGATANVKVRISGHGKHLFSLDDNMPYAANFEAQLAGMLFLPYRSDKFSLRVGFHRLGGWRSEFFDNGLMPTDDAMSPENLRRLTDKEYSTIKREWKSAKGFSLPHVPFLLKCAPPPNDSAFRKSVATQRSAYEKELATLNIDAEVSSAQVKAKVRHSQLEGRIENIDNLIQWWKLQQRLAAKFPRDWTDESKSFSVRATMLGTSQSNVVLRRLDNAQSVSVPLARLCAADREFVSIFGLPVNSAGQVSPSEQQTAQPEDELSAFGDP